MCRTTPGITSTSGRPFTSMNVRSLVLQPGGVWVCSMTELSAVDVNRAHSARTVLLLPEFDLARRTLPAADIVNGKVYERPSSERNKSSKIKKRWAGILQRPA